MATRTTDEKAALAAAEVAEARKFERSMKFLKKAVLEVQLILLDGVDTDAQLYAAGRILAQSEYGDVVEERYIAKVCGYARCVNALSTENTRKGRFRISLSAKKVYDLEESRHFCSPACLLASKDFGSKLPLRVDVVESSEGLIEILASVRGSQYAVRSKPVRLKDENAVKPPARPKNVKRGKARPKETKTARPVEDRGQLKAAVLLSSQLCTAPTEKNLENDNHEAVSSIISGLNTEGSLIRRHPEESNSSGTNANLSFSFQSTLVIPSTSGSDGEAAGTATKSSSNGQKLRPDKDSTISSTVQTKFEKLTIQERVGDQTVLPMFDYGGPSDAIEGYVPLRSHRDALSQAELRTQSKVSKSRDSSDVALKRSQQQEKHLKTSAESKYTGKEPGIMLREEVQNSERPFISHEDGERICKEWEGLVYGSPQADGAKMCITEVDREPRSSQIGSEFTAEDSAPSTSSWKSKDVQEKPAHLKPALKKQPKVKQNVRSVAWADQNTRNATTHIEKTKSKNRASNINADGTHTFEKSTEYLIKVEDKIQSMTLEDEERPKARLSGSSSDLAVAARLASAEAIASALTEAATSAANGELDGSEAVAQAGISILSASHNANTAMSPYEAEVQSSAIDEDQLFARAAQAREEMRRLKMPRNYSKLQDEKDGYDDGNLIDDFNPVANEGDDDSDDDANAADDVDVNDDVDDDDYDDDNGGFEGAHEVGFTAPPKGFKAEVSMFGTMFMALETWISAAAVAHIYGKEPQDEDEYLSVNGREYSRQTVIGDGVSAEILRTISLCVSRALPEVVRALRISVPLSTLELSLGRLVKTMSFVEALPPFGTKQWRMLTILLLDALSIQRVPRLGMHFSNNRSMMRKMLDSTGTSESEYDVFRDVVLPLGRSPTFSTLSGG